MWLLNSLGSSKYPLVVFAVQWNANDDSPNMGSIRLAAPGFTFNPKNISSEIVWASRLRVHGESTKLPGTQTWISKSDALPPTLAVGSRLAWNLAVNGRTPGQTPGNCSKSKRSQETLLFSLSAC